VCSQVGGFQRYGAGIEPGDPALLRIVFFIVRSGGVERFGQGPARALEPADVKKVDRADAHEGERELQINEV